MKYRLSWLVAACITLGCGSLGHDESNDQLKVVREISSRPVSSLADFHGEPIAMGAYRIHLIDVGTGLSVLVQGHDFNMLFDGGSGDDKAGLTMKGNRNRLVAYLFGALGPSGEKSCTPLGDQGPPATGAKIQIDHLVLSHPHDDHVSLLADVLNCYDVRNVWDSGSPYPSASYRHFLETIAAQSSVAYHTAAEPPVRQTMAMRAARFAVAAADAMAVAPHESLQPVKMPSNVTWTKFQDGDVQALGAGAQFKVLHADGTPHPNDANENSTVLKVQLGGRSLLLTGDAEAGPRSSPTTPSGDVLGDLLKRHAPDLRADILQVPHHGSKTSGRKDFLDAISPRWVLIGAGPKSYSGVVLPDEEVVEALSSGGPTLLRTDTHDTGGCPVADRIGMDDDNAGGCDNFVLDL